CSRVAAAYDCSAIALSTGHCNCFGSCSKWLHFENAHWSVPNYGLGFFDLASKKLAGLRTNVEAFPACWNGGGCDDLGLCVCCEAICNYVIQWQEQLYIALFCLFHKFFGLVDLILFEEGVADFIS